MNNNQVLTSFDINYFLLYVIYFFENLFIFGIVGIVSL